MDFLLGNKDYPLEAEWYEHNPKHNVDESDTWESAVLFHFKDITKSRRQQQDIQGLRKPVQSITIETRDKLAFKERDKVKIENREYKVTNVESVPDQNFSAKHIFKNLNLYKAVITLE
jgi:hypothetical protein